MSFKAIVCVCVFKLLFCLDNLSIAISGMFQSPTPIVLLSIYIFMSVNICFMYLGTVYVGCKIFTSVISSY